MIARDWLQIKTELDQLLSVDAERQAKTDAEDTQPRRTQCTADDAVLRHIADALRGGEIELYGGNGRRS